MLQVKSPSLWMKNARYDLIFFHLSALAFLLFLIPYGIWGAAVVFPIYSIYLVFFGLPHNYLTWSMLLPKSARPTFKWDLIMPAFIVCAIICLMLPFSKGLALNDWILSFISYYSLWHAYRQHHGLCKIYDSVQAKRTGDATIFKDRKALNLFFGLAANSIVVWAFTHPKINYLLSPDESYQLIYPQIPFSFFLAYLVVTFGVGIYALKVSVYDRYQAGRFIPYPQLLLMFMALLTYIVPYIFIPIDAMPLAVAIGTMFHNFQYFGFVWLFEKYRSRELTEANIPIELPARMALTGSWQKYFTVALLYSFLVIAVYLITPKQVGLTFIYFLGLSHYIIDGYVWRRDQNAFVGPFVSNLAGTRASEQRSQPEFKIALRPLQGDDPREGLHVP